MCMWISQEAGSSWECTEHTNVRSTLFFSDRARSSYSHLPSQTWLIRSLKQDKGRTLLPIAFYLYCWQTTGKLFLPEAAAVPSKRTAMIQVLSTKETLSMAFLPSSIFRAHVQDQVAHVRKILIFVLALSVKPVLWFQSALSFPSRLFLQLKVNKSWNTFFPQSFLTTDGHKCLVALLSCWSGRVTSRQAHGEQYTIYFLLTPSFKGNIYTVKVVCPHE